MVDYKALYNSGTCFTHYASVALQTGALIAVHIVHTSTVPRARITGTFIYICNICHEYIGITFKWQFIFHFRIFLYWNLNTHTPRSVHTRHIDYWYIYNVIMNLFSMLAVITGFTISSCVACSTLTHVAWSIRHTGFLLLTRSTVASFCHTYKPSS